MIRSSYRLALITLVAAASAAIGHAATPVPVPVPAEAAAVRPLAVGTTAPAFNARRPDGSQYRFDPATRAAPAVLVFYRGGWCPYCNTHLGELSQAETELKKRGYEVLFLSADRPEILRSSLNDETERDAAGYTLLSDSDAVASRAFGVAFRVDDATFRKYKSMGLDLEQASGNALHILPVPAVFVIDARGVIRFAHANPDYRVRLSAEALLAAAPPATPGG
jgi:peroxiredoxin